MTKVTSWEPLSAVSFGHKRIDERGSAPRAAVCPQVDRLNRIHHWICQSAWWSEHLERDLIPWALEGIHLGPLTAELGPGPGITSRFVAPSTDTLVCIEVDSALAKAARASTEGMNVQVVRADATGLPFRSERFDSVVAFTMLHHVTPARMQDTVFASAARILKPGGVFAGTDSLEGPVFRCLHWRSAMTAVHPEDLEQRLWNAGFTEVEIAVRKRDFRFRARRVAVE
ncbi:MAG: methyltransferase domain-containing protein [Bryobacterales bacterium]|nr:methyltransferase domain-containing protein [Bryobacterales bacterium]